MNIFYLQWHITNQCNNRCINCYQKNYDSFHDIKLHEAEEILADFKATCIELDAKSIITITGGDPLLHNDFFRIVSLASSQCDHVYIMGNPEMLIHNTKFDIDLIRTLDINGWQLSIDGLNKTHDYFRYKGSFERSLLAIDKLNEMGIEVSIMSTINQFNLHEMPSLLDLLYSRGIYSWDFCRYIPQNGDCGINPDNYRKFLNNIINKHSKFERNGHPPLKKDPLLNIFQKELPHSEKHISGCGLGSASLCLLPDKTLMACRKFFDSILGKWTYETGFLNHFLFNPKMNGYRDRTSYGKCSTCPYFSICRGCRAAAFHSNKMINGDDPQCWITQNQEINYE